MIQEIKQRKYIFAVILIILTSLLLSCTENSRTRRYGGKIEIILKPNEVCENIVWKDDNLWVKYVHII